MEKVLSKETAIKVILFLVFGEISLSNYVINGEF